MRVLISSYVCQRGFGSEPEVGYNYVRAAARRHDVTVLTHEIYVDGLREAIADGGLPEVEIVSFPTAEWTRKRLGKHGIGHVDYLLWQRQAKAWALAHGHRFDVAHHATYGSDWLPAGVLALRDTPVVWGSVGGISPVPWRLVRYLSAKGILGESVREVGTRAVRRAILRDLRGARALVIARNRETVEFFSARGLQVVLDPQVVALDPPEDVPVPVRTDGPRRALFVSKLVPWKGPLLAVAAIAEAAPDWQLEFFGLGPAEDRVRRFAAKLGVTDRVILHGRVPKADVLQAFREADALLFPAVHDSSPMPVAEAAWAGCPVVCLDMAGPAVLIEGTPGVAVPADRHAPRALAAALERVERHPPSNRWSPERLEASVDTWYAQAVAARHA